MASIDIELTSATATELAGLIAARDVAAVEVVAAHVRRIADVNGAINAVVALDAERALARAREDLRRADRKVNDKESEVEGLRRKLEELR